MNQTFNEIEVEMQDNAEHQIEHCFRTYEGTTLRVKLRELIGEWMWKGFHGGVYHEQNEREKWTSLDHQDFKDLVSGGVVTKGLHRIALKDIGYTTMLDAIDSSMRCGDILDGETISHKPSLADLHQREK